MPTTKSAKKRMRTNEERRLRNRAHKSVLKTDVKKAQAAIKGDDLAAADKAATQAQSRIARTAAKGVIHRNKAARTQSRLAKSLNAAKAAAAAPETE
ncbi:30S ribosomal protein S20 [Candidatus Sumerlaeota bacterium]